ncbi:MAG: virulence factor [Acidobacteriota bacterium]
MATYQILYWKHIPAQVKAFDEGSRRPQSRQLPPEFQHEIDREAMRLGLTGTDEYLSQWHWSPKMERPGPAQEVLERVLGEIVSEWNLPAEAELDVADPS